MADPSAVNVQGTGAAAAPAPAPPAGLTVTPAAPAGMHRENPAQPRAAALLLIAGLAVIAFTGLYHLIFHASPGYTGGAAAAAAGILFVLALILRFPALVMDDCYEPGGEPSTMRIMGLSIVLTFCILMIHSGWNSGTLPSLAQNTPWVWLVTAALGGKATQSYMEMKQK